jgi:hypothetical protein
MVREMFVHCALLLDRIAHVELVLDRFVSALRPGGLLLLRIRDRTARSGCSAGLPARGRCRGGLGACCGPGCSLAGPAVSRGVLQGRVRSRHPGVCARREIRRMLRVAPAALTAYGRRVIGRRAHAQLRGLVIVQRETAKTVPGGSDRLARAVSAARRLICRVSRGRLTDAHDEVLYVIRKPEDRFARVV